MIVGVLGFIGSGKGTVGDILIKRGFMQTSFASSLKDVASHMFGWPRHLLEGDTEESREFREKPDAFWSQEFNKDFTPRLALQLMGTEVGRNVFHENFWVIKAKQFIHKKMSEGQENFVITDVRFPNEIDMIRSEGGILIEVQRGVKPHWYDIAQKANKGDYKAENFMRQLGIHESEWRWIGGDIDYVIDNNKTVECLENMVVSCLCSSFGTSIIDDMK